MTTFSSFGEIAGFAFFLAAPRPTSLPPTLAAAVDWLKFGFRNSATVDWISGAPTFTYCAPAPPWSPSSLSWSVRDFGTLASARAKPISVFGPGLCLNCEAILTLSATSLTRLTKFAPTVVRSSLCLSSRRNACCRVIR